MPSTAYRNPNMAISLPAAITGGIILIVYFLLTTLLGYQTVTELRFLNFVFLIPIVIYSQRSYVNNVSDKSYLECLRVSFLSVMGAYAMLAAFMVFYLFVIDRSFMIYLQEYAVPGVKLNPFGAAALILGEGTIGAVILSFVTLQFYKDRIKNMA
ncbi:MAG: hypothetical protein M3Q95_11395 [Bacteroidota bacterium]|nr:hypothetical protein [Bacteroidota bacterium]